MEAIKVIENGEITSVKGFKASGVVANIKKLNSTKKDLCVILSDVNCNAAGVFTLNKVHSKTIDLDRENLSIRKGKIRAIVVNSGNANACVGQRGYEDAVKMAKIAAEELGISYEQVLVSSTGVIGVPLPMDRVEKGIREAVAKLSYNGGNDAMEAILTTDTTKKNIAVETKLSDGTKITIGAIAKGSGMIHPNMGTMLAYVTTDANVSTEILEKTLKEVTNKTFNMISVDRDTSTNDSLIILANGLAGNKEIDNENSMDCQIFKKALHVVLEYLAKAIAKDGEGATKFVEVIIKNALTFDDAKKVGMAVITSPLVKTALFGQDANWGRIIAAIGYSGAEVQEDLIDIYIGSIQVCENGIGILENEIGINDELRKKEIRIIIDLKLGKFDATVWGCDFSYDYVKINADYRS